MRTALTIIASLSLSSIAAADVARIDPLPDDHYDHRECHRGPDAIYTTTCKSLLNQEKDAMVNEINKGTKTTVVRPDGSKTTGRREAYDFNRITGSTSSGTFTELAWLKRFLPAAGASSHPEWESTNLSTMDNCNEYVYRRYYGPMRYLDALNSYMTTRNYKGGVHAILTGIPANGDAKAVFDGVGLQNQYMKDFDGRYVEYFNWAFNGYALPQFTATSKYPIQYRNEFFGYTPQLWAHHNGRKTHDDQWEADLDAAIAYSTGQYSRNASPPADEFENARQLRYHTDVYYLSASESEDIAARVDKIRKAAQRASHSFTKCVMNTYRNQTAQLGYNYSPQTAADFRDIVYATQPGYEFTDPVDRNEIALLGSILDTTWGDYNLQNMLQASTASTSTSIWSQYARTRLGGQLRSMNLKLAIQGKSIGPAVSYVRSQEVNYGDFAGCTMTADFEEVREALVDEYRRHEGGCMSQANRRCDFVPKLFVQDQIEKLESLTYDVDKAKQECYSTLGQFWDYTFGRVDPAKRYKLADLESYITERHQLLDQIARDVPRRSVLPGSYGDRRDGTSEWGDPGRFSAGYSYSTEYGVNITEKDAAGHVCKLGGRVGGKLEAHVTVLNYRADLLNVRMSATTKQPNMAAPYNAGPVLEGDITIGDVDIWQPIDEHFQQAILDYNPEDTKQTRSIDLVRTTIVLGFVPVTVTAGIDLDMGYALEMDTDQPYDCTNPRISMSGEVTPFAGIDGHVSAYVDLFILGAGVKGKLTLVEARVPFTASLSTVTTNNETMIHASTSASIILQELAGSFSFFVEVIGITVWEHELFSWGGFKQTIRLWKDTFDLPAVAFH